MEEQVRIDKWLWAVRLYKTRSIATEECKKGRVLVDGVPVKPSRVVKLDDKIVVRKLPVLYTYKVTGIISKRVSAQIAQQQYEDMTSIEELNKLKIQDTIFIRRDKGTGRPTKRDRRMIDKLREGEE